MTNLLVETWELSTISKETCPAHVLRLSPLVCVGNF